MKYLLLFFISQAVQAQVTWSETGSNPHRIVKGMNDELITVSFARDPYTGWRPITPVVTRYNKNMQVVLTKELFTTGENVHFHSAYNFRDHIYLFTTWYNRSEKKMILYCTEIDPLTLEVKYQKEINRFDGIGRSGQSGIQIKASRDTSHILVFAGKMVVQVLDYAMNKDWGKVITLPYAGKFVVVQSIEISNAGDVYILYRHHKQELLRERMNVRTIVSDKYTCKVLVCRRDDTARVEYVPDVQKKFVHDVTLHVDNKDTIHLLGLYKDKYRGRVTGHFNIQWEGRTLQTVSTKFVPLSGLSNYFTIMGTNLRQDGSVDLLTEVNYHRTESDSNCHKEIYEAGDIYVINYKKDGMIYYTRVPKWQREEDGQAFISFKWMNSANDLLLFYNDKNAFIMASVNDTGELKRETLYKDLLTFINASQVFNQEALALYVGRYRLFTRSKFRVGKLKIPYNSPAIQ